MSRDTHKRLFNGEQDNKAETGTNSCPTHKLYYKRKEKLNTYKIAYCGVHIHCTRFYLKLITVTKIQWIGYNSMIHIAPEILGRIGSAS